uniref:Uncharacterized protein n=1 Tax=Aegilops tauschii TaxID=37682 RepID=N1QSY1_AEGTA
MLPSLKPALNRSFVDSGLSISEFTCYRPKPPNPANATLDPCSYTDSLGRHVREGRGPPVPVPGATNVKGNPSIPCINCSVSLKNRLRLLLASLAALHAVLVLSSDSTLSPVTPRYLSIDKQQTYITIANIHNNVRRISFAI